MYVFLKDLWLTEKFEGTSRDFSVHTHNMCLVELALIGLSAVLFAGLVFHVRRTSTVKSYARYTKGKVSGLVEELDEQKAKVENLLVQLGDDLNEHTHKDASLAAFSQAFLAYLDENYQNEGLRKEDFAKAMNMCERTLNRKLNDCYNDTFCNILRSYRLSKAKTMIAQGHQITEACYASGFSSSSYFSRCFKTQYGYIPSETRGFIYSQIKKY